ncbi:murein hydrolase activator EnvC family protein [Mucilaginibacter calamicampi]|uniref:Murein hydrolase activator EnvC family protein n=1 Tax=Mucilaginibacter calamicampi TaxID=1302352 RepID=A0ABW2YXL9_9SPHI
MKFLKVLFFLICVVATLSVSAQSSEQLKRDRDRLTDELEKLNREYNETVNNKKSTLKQLNILRAQINLREKKIDNINVEVRNLNSEITENTNVVHSLEQQLKQLREEYKAMILFAYHNKSGYNKMMFVFAAKDFNQAYKRLKYLQEFAAYRKRQAGYIEEKEKELYGRIVQLDKTKEEKRNMLLEQQKEKENLGKERSNQQKVASSLTKQESQLVAQRRELQRKIAAATREIIRKTLEEARKREEAERAAAAARAKAANKDAPAPAPVARKTDSQVLNATPEAAALSSSFLGNRGRLPWPVTNGIITQGFGTSKMDGIVVDNDGVDIRTSSAAAVRAVFEGQVRTVQDIMGAYMVVIQHGEYFTVYSNLRSASVSVGQKVSTKQTLGTAATDAATGETVIQFKLYKAGVQVNPEPWLANR